MVCFIELTCIQHCLFSPQHMCIDKISDGETTLLEKGVQDKPLLNLAAENNEILSFVHFVDEEVDEDSPINNESNVENIVDDASEDADDWDCFDEESDEEAEFEG